MDPYMPLWIKNPLSALADDADGGIVIDRSQIVELVAKGQTPTIAPLSEIQIFDASELVLLPGLINTHHHFYQTLTRACPPALNKPLFPWLQALYPIWANLTPEMIQLSSRLALAELLLSGCTTAADHHYLFPSALNDAIDIQVAEAQLMQMRVMLTRGSMSLGEDQGGLPPQSTVQSEQEILEDSLRLVKTHHQTGPGAMIQIALAPCSPFSVSTELMKETAVIASDLNVRLHTHLAETHDETDFCLKMFGMRPLDYLEHVGWLSDRTWLAHGIHFDPSEIQRLGNAGTGICHCPSSNMVLSSGICPTLDLQRAGAPVGLGVDGSASNDGSNLIQEIRQALMIGRLRYDADEMTHFKALNFATKGSARCLGREDIGSIAVGQQADIALFGLDELRFSGAGDPMAALLLCGAHKAAHVMVGGNWRVKDGELLGLDLKALQRQHTEMARRLTVDN
jgi:8-oxoguanine deaminase